MISMRTGRSTKNTPWNYQMIQCESEYAWTSPPATAAALDPYIKIKIVAPPSIGLRTNPGCTRGAPELGVISGIRSRRRRNGMRRAGAANLSSRHRAPPSGEDSAWRRRRGEAIYFRVQRSLLSRGTCPAACVKRCHGVSCFRLCNFGCSDLRRPFVGLSFALLASRAAQPALL